jgi:hypothetical protein
VLLFIHSYFSCFKFDGTVLIFLWYYCFQFVPALPSISPLGEFLVWLAWPSRSAEYHFRYRSLWHHVTVQLLIYLFLACQMYFGIYIFSINFSPPSQSHT